MVKRCRHLLLSCLLLLPFAVQATVPVIASIDQPELAVGETLRLSLTINDAGNAASPNTKDLKKDFDIISTARRNRIVMINGKTTSKSQWVFELMPKHAGTITIPAIDVGGQKSQPLMVKVGPSTSSASPDAQAAANDNKAVFLTAELEPKNLYVQSQGIYTLKIFFSVNVQNPTLTEPQADNAMIMHINNDRNYKKIIDGKHYQVLERHYAIFPQQSGDMTINGPIFSGDVLATNQAMTGSSRMITTGWHTLRAAAKPIALKVKPIPAAANQQWWLPAADVKLSEKWSDNPPKFHVGQPITRTLTLEASGLAGTQLPALDLPTINGVQTYPDKPETDTLSNGQTIIGKRVEKIAMIPDKAGDITLPEVNVTWWNTQTNHAEIAKLPARKVTVLPATSGEANDATNQPLQPLTLDAKKTADDAIATPAQIVSSKSATVWEIISGVLFIAWLATLLVWWRSRQHTTDTEAAKAEAAFTERKESIARSKKNLKKRCDNNDPKAAANALVQYGQCLWPDARIRSLGDVAANLSSNAAKLAVTELDKMLYTDNDTNWSGKHFWQVVNKELVKHKVSAASDRDVIPKLHLR
ncbi:MAG: hypothetical protein CMF50_06430 [Legionellales bacterium]|nr:hypothetical protein [Legionellales bacterium]|tara:strand:+ start:10169 stop:11926 length:1758 start_codon:yes stop_codon:yes gene_type:complete